MKRKLLLLSLTLLLAFSSIVYAAGVNGVYKGHNVVKVTLDGKEVKPDGVPGYLDGDYTMVPLGLLRKMGITVEWDAKRLTANVKLPPPRTVPVLIKSQLDELSKSVYEVYGSTNDPKIGNQGSGFFIGDVFVTNFHVAGNSKYVLIYIDGAWQRYDQFVFKNEQADIVGIKATGGISLPLATTMPEVNDPVYDISYPHGVLTVTEGKVREITKMYTGYTEIIHTAETDPGGSGGILLNGRGEIIGMNESELANTSFAIPISFVVDELNK